MSAFYDQASLVVVPSGYKAGKVYAQKPLTTDGQLEFTRSTGATRVNSAGLIERVRTNVLLQSNTFNTTWTTARLNVTSGQSDPNGGTTAWKISNNTTVSSSFSFMTQSVTGRTFSIYAKAGEITQMLMYVGNNRGVYFDLTDGSFVGWYSVTTNINYSSTSVGGGWYRYVVTLTDTDIVVAEVYTAAAGSLVYNIVSGEGLYIWRSQVELGDIATDYIETTSAAVSVGPVANVPRLDYLGSSCPRLLLEPQRTNLATYSEQFNHPDWSKAETTVTANAIVSPDGYTNADKIESTLTIGCYVNQSTTNTGVYTHSVYAKAGNVSSFTILWASYNSGKAATFDLSNGTVTTVGATVSATITAVGNGWYRCTTTDTSANYIVLFSLNNPTNTPISVGSYIYLWGAQAEAGAYATSYIPTLGAAVTRGADACSKTGITSLIGQTEGTLFVDVNRTQKSQNYQVPIFIGVNPNIIQIYFTSANALVAQVYTSAGQQVAIISSALPNGRYKAAISYKANDFAFYINGVQIGTDTSGSVPTCSQLIIGNDDTGNSNIGDSINQTLLFKTRLTNAQLAELTSL